MVNGICPYCQFEFDRPATRKKKCPKCKNQLFVSYYPWDDKEDKRYVSEEDYISSQVYWGRYWLYIKFLTVLDRFEPDNTDRYKNIITRDDFETYCLKIIEPKYYECTDIRKKIALAEVLNGFYTVGDEKHIDIHPLKIEEFSIIHKKTISECQSHGIKQVEFVTFPERCKLSKHNGKLFDVHDEFVQNFKPCKDCDEIYCDFIAHVDFDA